MTRRLALGSIALAALAALALLVLVAPAYLTQQGFPLDDAWIHAVYGRELARSGMLAYNPGVPATGSTAPLWSALFAFAHLVTGRVGSTILLVKLIGFALHVGTAFLVYAALDGGPTEKPMRLAGALLVALHPDLVSASVSGMEIPLAACAAAALWYAASRASGAVYGILSGAAVLARPELGVLSVTLPLLGVWGDRRRVRNALTAAAGGSAALGLIGLRSLAVSGLPLPATFYAKVGAGPGMGAGLGLGFRELLGGLPVVDSSILLTGLGVLSLAILAARTPRPRLVDAASAFVSGLLFCAVSFLLIAPVDPSAFYHQRYVLPALPLIIGPLPLLFDAWLSDVVPAWWRWPARSALLLLLGVSLVVAAPTRFRHLASDAQNIDDVQVAVGRSLAGAQPTDVVWAIDAGAIRYFGSAFVVDMIGLNTPEMIGPTASTFLSAHEPRYLELVPGWSSLREAEAAHLERTLFRPSTPYTVTAFQPMQNHVLVRCGAAGDAVRFTVGTRTFDARCADGARG